MRRNSRCQLGPGKNRSRREVITGLYRLHFSRAETDSRNRRPLAPAVPSGGRSSCDAGTASPARTGLAGARPSTTCAQHRGDGRIRKGGGIIMLRWAVIFLVIALVAALFGFTGIASAAAGIAKFLFFLFLVICLIFLTIGISAGRRIP